MKRLAIFALSTQIVLTISLGAQVTKTIDFGADYVKGVPGYKAALDHRTGNLILYRNDIPPTLPSVKMITEKGNTASITPLNDLPGARRLRIWAVAATKDEGVAMSVIAEYGEKGEKRQPLKTLIMIYSGNGKLKQLWDVYPYHHHQITIDDSGNIFALGTKNTSDTDYPLLVKYAPDGKVLGEYLHAKMFPMGGEVAESISPIGESRIFMDEGEVVLWLAPTSEIIRLSTSGKILSRYSLEKAFASLLAQGGGSTIRVSALDTSGSHNLFLQVQLLPAQHDNNSVTTATAEISDAGNKARFTSVPINFKEASRFVGVGPDGLAVYLECTASPLIVNVRQQPR